MQKADSFKILIEKNGEMEALFFSVAEAEAYLKKVRTTVDITPTPVPPVVTNPIKEPPIEVEPEPTPPKITRADLLGLLAGKSGNDNVYTAKDGNWYYQDAGGKLWPRGTNFQFNANLSPLVGNPARDGWPGVPLQYALPKGWGWFKAGDGAYAIVPEQTSEPGPDWINKPTPQPEQPGKDNVRPTHVIGSLFEGTKNNAQ